MHRLPFKPLIRIVGEIFGHTKMPNEYLLQLLGDVIGDCSLPYEFEDVRVDGELYAHVAICKEHDTRFTIHAKKSNYSNRKRVFTFHTLEGLVEYLY